MYPTKLTSSLTESSFSDFFYHDPKNSMFIVVTCTCSVENDLHMCMYTVYIHAYNMYRASNYLIFLNPRPLYFSTHVLPAILITVV